VTSKPYFLSHIAFSRPANPPPSAYLDVEERLTIAKSIRRVGEIRRTLTFLVDHDIAMIDYVANRVMVFQGIPGVEGVANPPEDLRSGMNRFLRDVNVTFRRDQRTGRPRVNKPGSYLDRKKKAMGEYYYAPLREDGSGES
jgi:ATP-binding cassette subfamily E protein 1